MKDKLKTLGIFLLIFAFFGSIVACHVSIWRECRTTNSFLYCARVLGK